MPAPLSQIGHGLGGSAHLQLAAHANSGLTSLPSLPLSPSHTVVDCAVHIPVERTPSHCDIDSPSVPSSSQMAADRIATVSTLLSPKTCVAPPASMVSTLD